MHDPKFEKEVQRKMEELAFSPSEAVWANVERAVSEKKRRRVPLFWLFFLPALLLMGAGAAWFAVNNASPARPERDGQSPTSPAATVIPIQSISAAPAVPAANKILTDNRPIPGSSSAPALRSVPAGTLSPPSSAPSRDASSKTFKRSPIYAFRKSGKRSAITAGAEDPEKRPEAHPGIRAGYSPAETGATGGSDGTKDADAIGAATGAAGLHPEAQERQAQRVSTGNIVPVGQLAGRSLNMPAIGLSANGNSKALKKIQVAPPHPWEFGFTGGAGISSLQRALFQPAITGAILTSPSTNYTAISNPLQDSSRAGHSYISSYQAGPSFWAGIVMQKTVLRDISVSLGLNLHYYSSKVKTGTQVSAYSPSSASLFLTQSQSLTANGQAYPYYSAGNEQSFVNRYYFLELPGSLQWQLTHSGIMPLFWEAGVSLSYLMSSNALYYNPHSGVFYKDAGVTNRTQFNVSTALMVGLPFGGGRIQAGPQLQYGVSSLLNTQAAGNQHLFFGGIKLVYLPGKHKHTRLFNISQ